MLAWCWWFPSSAIRSAALDHMGFDPEQSIQPSTVDHARPTKVCGSFTCRWWTSFDELHPTDGCLAAVSIWFHVNGPCQLWYVASFGAWVRLRPCGWWCFSRWCSFSARFGHVSSAMECWRFGARSSNTAMVRCWSRVWALNSDHYSCDRPSVSALFLQGNGLCGRFQHHILLGVICASALH